MVPKGDPSVLASLLTQFTTRLGVIPTLSTSEYQPYMLARLVATLDQVSQGRSGWNMVTGSSDLAARNYGRDGLPADAWMTYGMADVTNLLRLLDTGEATDRQRRIERQKIEALIGYCEAVSCRRQVLLGYFGEAEHSPCGNCDNCRTPVPSWDGTIAAQKALSAIYRTGQRFGTRHLVDVLLGAETERIVRLRHNRLKTFGVGTELDRRGWLSVFRQLVAQGLVLPDVAGHGGLSLAPGAAEILRGTRAVRFRLEARAGERRSSRPDRKAGAATAGLDPASGPLWEALRAWRLEEARRQELPPYVIFHDSTLIEVARRRPGSLTALADIPGVGRSKLERYGSAVIGIVAGSAAHPGFASADTRRPGDADFAAPRETGAEAEMPS